MGTGVVGEQVLGIPYCVGSDELVTAQQAVFEQLWPEHPLTVRVCDIVPQGFVHDGAVLTLTLRGSSFRADIADPIEAAVTARSWLQEVPVPDGGWLPEVAEDPEDVEAPEERDAVAEEPRRQPRTRFPVSGNFLGPSVGIGGWRAATGGARWVGGPGVHVQSWTRFFFVRARGQVRYDRVQSLGDSSGLTREELSELAPDRWWTADGVFDAAFSFHSGRFDPRLGVSSRYEHLGTVGTLWSSEIGTALVPDVVWAGGFFGVGYRDGIGALGFSYRAMPEVVRLRVDLEVKPGDYDRANAWVHQYFFDLHLSLWRAVRLPIVVGAELGMDVVEGQQRPHLVLAVGPGR